MYNWNDVEVEQKIAQERYQTIVEAHRVARARQRSTAGRQLSSSSGRLLRWLGGLLVRLGCALQKRRGSDLQAAACH